MIAHNQELLYGLKKAMETVEACDAGGVEVHTITVAGASPTFTTRGGTTAGGVELPFARQRAEG